MPRSIDRLKRAMPPPVVRGARFFRRGVSYVLIREELDRMEGRLSHDMHSASATMVESVAYIGRTLRDLQVTIQPWRALRGAPFQSLDGESAEFLNYAESHLGFAAQAGVWFNPPISLRYAEQSVAISSVSERIVEVPYALRALCTLPEGASVLDVGATESTIALSLASLGYRVTALDLRPYPFDHPNLTVVTSELEAWSQPAQSFDAVLVISAIEHFGLGAYGEQSGSDDADAKALARLRELVKDRGRLVLTVPFGRPGVDRVQRVYDRPGVERLVGDRWSIEDYRIAQQISPTQWGIVDESQENPSLRAAALISARAV
jgi:SAM-dependent methyltransferase